MYLCFVHLLGPRHQHVGVRCCPLRAVQRRHLQLARLCIQVRILEAGDFEQVARVQQIARAALVRKSVRYRYRTATGTGNARPARPPPGRGLIDEEEEPEEENFASYQDASMREFGYGSFDFRLGHFSMTRLSPSPNALAPASTPTYPPTLPTHYHLTLSPRSLCFARSHTMRDILYLFAHSHGLGL